jgi:Tol biopolymer transport system component
MSTTLFRRPTVMLAFALCSVGAVVTLMGRLATGPAVQQKRSQLSTGDGAEAYPSVSPDGKRMAYCAREGGKVTGFHLYVRELPAGAPRQLTKTDSNDVSPVWSPDGATLAFLRVEGERTQYMVIPADGGDTRLIAESGTPPDADKPAPAVSWAPDGKSLAVVQFEEEKPAAIATVSASGGKLQVISKPIEGTEGDDTPAFSPSGSTLAFVRHAQNGSDIFLCEPNGANPHAATFDGKNVRGISWSHDGQDLVYSSDRARGWALWRVPAYGGAPRELTIAGNQAYYPAVGRNRLVYTDSPVLSSIWRATLGAGDASTATDDRPIIRSIGRETSPAYSPDGTKIVNVSAETNYEEIFLSDADGHNRVQLTHLEGPHIGRLRWAPDSKTLIYDASSDHGTEVFLLTATPGSKPQRVLLNANNASISRDGKRIYFQSRGQIWKSDIHGANPEALTDERGAGQPVESFDGKTIFFRGRRNTFESVPVEGGEAKEVIVPDHDLVWVTTIQPVKKGVYFTEFERSSRSVVVSFYDFATKKNTVAFRMKTTRMGFDMGNYTVFSVSPDGTHILYPRVDQSQTNLMLVENFR